MKHHPLSLVTKENISAARKDAEYIASLMGESLDEVCFSTDTESKNNQHLNAGMRFNRRLLVYLLVVSKGFGKHVVADALNISRPGVYQMIRSIEEYRDAGPIDQLVTDLEDLLAQRK